MSQSQNPYLLLKNVYPDLHKVGKKIADYIMNNDKKVAYMTIASIAKEVNVAESSIVKFSKDLGYSGFTDLKLSIVKYANPSKVPIYEDINIEDDDASIINKVFHGNINALKDTLSMLDFNAMSQAIEIISKAKKIVLFAVGSSAPIAEDFYHRFMRIGMNVHVSTDPFVSCVAAEHMTEDSVAIAISHKGRSPGTINSLRIAKDKGATTISVTSFLNSPLTEYTDITLCISSKETELLSEAISSRVSHITILDCLYAGVAIKRKETALPLIENMNKLYDTYRL